MNSLKTFNFEKMNKSENLNNLNIFLKNNVSYLFDILFIYLNSRIYLL